MEYEVEGAIQRDRPADLERGYAKKSIKHVN